MARPDIIVIVLDCARAGSVEPSLASAPPGSALGRFYRESTRFPVAVASSPWTVPSHATLFTGAQVWEHGCHNHGALRLAPTIPTVAEELAGVGYRSAAISENPLVSPATGVTRGFDLQAWGSTARWLTRTDVGGAPHLARGPGALSGRPPAGASSALARLALFGLHRFPFLPALSAAVTAPSRPSEEGREPRAGGWVSREVLRALDPDPDGRSLFLFVNLLDPHEPYLQPGAEGTDLRRRLGALLVPQDQQLYLIRPDLTANGNVAALLPGYARAVARSVARVGEILETVRARGRWDDSLIVVTSDHGQAFGEHANLFHGIFVHEENLRIPLYVKFPGSARAPEVGVGTAGLVDFAATVRDLLGLEPGDRGEGESWRTLAEHRRSGPLRAVGDGIRGGRALKFYVGADRFAALDRQFGVAYDGTEKVAVSGAELSVHARVGEDLAETPWGAPPDPRLLESARDAWRRLAAPSSPGAIAA